MLRQRVLVGVVAAPIAVAVTWIGGWPFFILVCAVLAQAMRELFTLAPFRSNDGRVLGYLGLLTTLIGVLLFGERALGIAVTWMVIVLLVQGLVRRSHDGLSGATWTLFIWLYVVVLGSHFLLVRGLADGRFYTLFALLVTWSFDTAAFFYGRKWGRTRFIPDVSPGKSVQGFAAGFVAAAVAAAALAVFVAPALALGGLSVSRALLLGGCVAVAGQGGDLAESLIKRACRVKDSGTLLPGHGGILDRIDSLLFVMVVIYYLVS